ncbi:hypothetical protein GCM10009818_07430 [Nakamurella flavida]
MVGDGLGLMRDNDRPGRPAAGDRVCSPPARRSIRATLADVSDSHRPAAIRCGARPVRRPGRPLPVPAPRSGSATGPVVTRVSAAPSPTTTELPATDVTADAPWVTIVWNDPVNLMSYVTLVFQRLLGHPRPRAESLMLDVHHKGRATVSSGTREQMEADVTKLQGAGLWATLAQDR